MKVDFQGSQVTSDGGLILVRELVYSALAGYENMNDAEHLSREPTLPKRIDSWSLTSLQQRLVKTGGRLVK